MHQPQFGLESGGDLAHARFQVGGRRHQPAPFAQHLVARGREADARTLSHEERDAQLLLEACPMAYEMVEGTLCRRSDAAANEPWRAIASTSSMASRLSFSTGVPSL